MQALAQDRLLTTLRAQRLRWVQVEPGIEVQFRRPLEAELARFAEGGVTVEHVCDYVVGWRGVTEATLLGAAVGSGDVADFTPALWSEYVRDRIDVVRCVAAAIADAVSTHLANKAAITKNSEPFSTPSTASN